MARQSRKDYSSELAKYKKKLREVKKAESAIQREARKLDLDARKLDLKIKILRKRIAEMPFHPFVPFSDGPMGSRKSPKGSRKK